MSNFKKLKKKIKATKYHGLKNRMVDCVVNGDEVTKISIDIPLLWNQKRTATFLIKGSGLWNLGEFRDWLRPMEGDQFGSSNALVRVEFYGNVEDERLGGYCANVTEIHKEFFGDFRASVNDEKFDDRLDYIQGGFEGVEGVEWVMEGEKYDRRGRDRDEEF